MTTAEIDLFNTFFDKIIVLTIERNKHRMEIINQVLEGIKYEIFIGVDGSKLNLEDMQLSGQVSTQIDEIYKKTNMDYLNMASPPIHINQVACAMSHVEIYRYIKDKYPGADKILILEDDTVPIEKNMKYLKETLKEIPTNWEVLYLGHLLNNDFGFWANLKYYHLTHFLYKIGLKSKAVMRKKITYATPYSKRLRTHGAHTGTHAYAVRYSILEKLIALQEPLQQVAPDLLLMDAIAKDKVISYTSKCVFFEQNPNINSSIWGK